jgi:uncharacterized protein
MQFEAAKDFILSKQKSELPSHLFYHSITHINDVYSAAEQIAKGEGIDGEELLLLLTAVVFHDSGFLVQQKDHEMISAEMARTILPDFGYNANQIEVVCGMILATKVPQKPNNHLEQIICDADLDYLGRDDFYTIGNKLFTELSLYGIIRTEEEWNHLQVKFLENHSYFTKTAIQLRQAGKDAHLNEIKNLLQQVKQ